MVLGFTPDEVNQNLYFNKISEYLVYMDPGQAPVVCLIEAGLLPPGSEDAKGEG